MKTTYPPQQHSCPEELQAYAGNERLRMYSKPSFNRLRIDENIREFNHRVKEQAARRHSTKEKQNNYFRAHRMSVTRLGVTVFPDRPVNTATGYISQLNKGTRFSPFTPAIVLSIAKVLDCRVEDLFEVVK